MAYAESTTVPIERSISEIVTLVKKAGADHIGQMESNAMVSIQFMLEDRLVRFRVPIPSFDETPTHDGRKSQLSTAQRLERRDQMVRQRGRALLLVVKAKLESVESGVETFEQAFLANVVMANGETIHERIEQHIEREYETGAVQSSTGLFLEGPR